MISKASELSVAGNPAFAWLAMPELQALFDLINRDGEEVRVVGGAVRNALIGAKVSDIDCATTAMPDQVMDWAHEDGIRAIPTGLDHGTVTLLIEGRSFEVTTLRSDVETDGRHAKVQFGRDWEADAYRRDFTMNAVYVDRTGRLYDPTGKGIEDAKAGFVRFIGNADARIAEDYLRVLRFFRFYAHYGQAFSDADFHACVAAQGSLDTLSGERVGVEMGKLLAGRYAANALHAMHDGGMLTALLRSAPRLTRFQRLTHLAEALRLEPDLVLLLTSLAIDVAEDALRIAAAWRLSNRQRDAMAHMARTVRTITHISEDIMQRLAYVYGKDLAIDLVLLALVRRQIKPDLTALSMMMRNLDLWEPPVFSISGRDLLERGMRPGPQLGAVLARLEEAWIDSGFLLSKRQLLSWERLKKLSQ